MYRYEQYNLKLNYDSKYQLLSYLSLYTFIVKIILFCFVLGGFHITN